MSTCISRHGEYGSHTYGEGAERFVCQRCGVLDEDAMIAALATAEAEVERRWAAIGCRGCHAGSCRGHLAPEASAINSRALIAAEAERDRLFELNGRQARDIESLQKPVQEHCRRWHLPAIAERDALAARLQAVRDLIAKAAPCHVIPDCMDHREIRASDLLAALDASLGTPGDEKPPELPVEPLSVGDVKRVWTDAIQQVAASDGSYTVEIGGVAITKAGAEKIERVEPPVESSGSAE